MENVNKKRLTRQQVIFLGFAVFLVMTHFFVSTVQACTCVRTVPFEEEYQNAELIFSGKAVKVDSSIFGRARFQVNHVWKGAVPTLLETTIDYGCMDAYRPDETYLVFAYRVRSNNFTEAAYRAGGCGQTVVITHAKRQLELLGQGYSPRKLTLLEKIEIFKGWSLTIVFGSMLLFFAVIACLRKSRKSFTDNWRS